MSVTTMELYEALIEAGVDEYKAKKAAAAVVSRGEAEKLTTKSDLKAEMGNLRAELYRAMSVQTLAIIAGVVGILQLLN